MLVRIQQVLQCQDRWHNLLPDSLLNYFDKYLLKFQFHKKQNVFIQYIAIGICFYQQYITALTFSDERTCAGKLRLVYLYLRKTQIVEKQMV